METIYAIPDFQHTKLALVVQLGGSVANLNLVIFFTDISEVRWNNVRDLVANPAQPVFTGSISSSPWMYICCDYTVGALLGLIEVLTSKHFRDMPNPMKDDFIVKYCELS